MAKFIYTGEMPSFYPMFYPMIPAGAESVNLYAQMDDVVDFPEDDEGNPIVPPGPWVPYIAPVKKTKANSTEVTE